MEITDIVVVARPPRPEGPHFVAKKSANPLGDVSTNWCHCGRARRRPGQSNCVLCHREHADKSNASKAKRLFALEQRLNLLTSYAANNPTTAARPNLKFGDGPHVTVLEHEANPHGWFRAFIVAYLPGDVVLVQHEFHPKTFLFVHLNELEKDNRLPHLRSPAPEPAPDTLAMVLGEAPEPFLTPKPRQKKARESGGNMSISSTRPGDLSIYPQSLNTHQNGNPTAKRPSYLPPLD
jgi:hypothetical protein